MSALGLMQSLVDHVKGVLQAEFPEFTWSEVSAVYITFRLFNKFGRWNAEVSLSSNGIDLNIRG